MKFFLDVYLRVGKVEKLNNMSLIKVVDFSIKFHRNFGSKKFSFMDMIL